MINIKTHIISEAFEQLSKTEKLNESVKSDLLKLFKSKGFDLTREDVHNYIDSAAEYIEMALDADGSYSVEEWYKDTLQNYPEDLEELLESKLVENDKFDIRAVLNANGDYEDLTKVVKDPSKIIVYDTWNQMLKDRDNRHTYYIRLNGDKEYEVMKYSKWSGDQYVGYIGPRGYSSLEELYARNPGKYDTDDVCLVKEFHYDDKDFDESFLNFLLVIREYNKLHDESKITEKLDKREVDLKLLNKDPSIFVSPEDAFELSLYLDSKNILYDTRNVMTPIPEKNYEKIPQRAFDIDYSSLRSIATPNEMVTLRHSDCSILGSISALTSAFDFPYISPASNKLPRISRSDYYKLKSLFKDLNKIWKKPEYLDKQNELVDKISDIVSEIQGIDESLNESEKPLRKMNTNELRDIAVSLGADRKKLYGTSKQALMLTIDLLKKKNKDNSRGNISVNKIAEDYNEVNECKLGTNEYEANPKRKLHIEMYRKFANLNESEEITEDNINDWALQKTATYCNRHPDRIKAEILGKRYSEYERD